MGYTHHINHQKPSMLSNFGNKIRTGAEVIGGIKTAFEIGRSIYSGIQTAAPYVQAGLSVARTLL